MNWPQYFHQAEQQELEFYRMPEQRSTSREGCIQRPQERRRSWGQP